MHHNLLHCESGHECPSFSTCDWIDDDGNKVIHERNYHWSFPSGPKTSYWLTQVVYMDINLANTDAKTFGFVVQIDPYCAADAPVYFPIFNNMDKALVYLNAQLAKENKDYMLAL